jgi:hypothetical protein
MAVGLEAGRPASDSAAPAPAVPERWRGAVWFLAIAVVFTVSYTVRPFFTSNQNHHFLKGLADAGVGFLADDWQVRTADPFPLFSAIVAVAWRHHLDLLCYAVYGLLFGAYATTALAAAAAAERRERPAGAALLVFALFTLIHNEVFGYLFVVDREHLAWWQATHWGVAGQEIFGHGAFQASSFGMLLPLAILLFLRGRPVAASAVAALVVDLHASYALVAASLVAAFVGLTAWRDRTWRQPLLAAGLAGLLVLPAAVYTDSAFAPTSPEIASRAAHILADHLPFEALPSGWLGPTTWFQIGLVAVALWLVRRDRLATVLGVPATLAVGLTAVEVKTGSDMLGLMFPWRPSVLVVPMASAIILTRLVWSALSSRAADRPTVRRALTGVAVAILAFTVGSGIVRMTLEFAFYHDYRPVTGAIEARLPARLVRDFRAELRPDSVPLFAFVRRTVAKGDLYLIPPDMQRFRTNTGAPALVDFKSHPYKDVEVLEWDRRLKLADRFYADQGDCAGLQSVLAAYPVTHVVLDRGRSLAVCAGLEPLFVDASYGVYRVTRR